MLPFMRWAFTPPFHPYSTKIVERYIFCDTLRLERLAPIQAHCFQWIAALKSPDFPLDFEKNRESSGGIPLGVYLKILDFSFL